MSKPTPSCSCGQSRPLLNPDSGVDFVPDAAIVASADAAPVSLPDAGALDSGFPDATPMKPPTPQAPPLSPVSGFPEGCGGFPASFTISTSSVGESFYITCTGDRIGLYRRPLASSNPSSTSWKPFVLFPFSGRYPANHRDLGDGYSAIAHTNPHGVTLAKAGDVDPPTTLDFSTQTLRDINGSPLGFKPSYPNGMDVVHDQTGTVWLNVNTSNLNHIDTDPAKTTFHSGTVISCPYLGQGQLDTDHCIVRASSGSNLTSAGSFTITSTPPSEIFAAVNAGPYTATASASVDIFSIAEQWARKTVPLGPVGAQVSSLLFIDPAGIAIVGLRKIEHNPSPFNFNGFAEVDLTGDGSLLGIHQLSNLTNFPSDSLLYEGMVGTIGVVADFGNAIGNASDLFLENLAPWGWPGILPAAAPGSIDRIAVSHLQHAIYGAITTLDSSGQPTGGEIVAWDMKRL